VCATLKGTKESFSLEDAVDTSSTMPLQMFACLTVSTKGWDKKCINIEINITFTKILYRNLMAVMFLLTTTNNEIV
jgi:hypothetical protein